MERGYFCLAPQIISTKPLRSAAAQQHEAIKNFDAYKKARNSSLVKLEADIFAVTFDCSFDTRFLRDRAAQVRDIDVRCAVRAHLQALHKDDHSTLIVEEMGIWSGSVRVDLAVINGELAGIELKSARDTLARLPMQASLYNKIFDRVTLVLASKHALEAQTLVPNGGV